MKLLQRLSPLALWLGPAMAALAVLLVFLSHWSLLDGAPRNSLGLFLLQQAERPFAYRWLMPVLVQGLQAILPAEVQEVQEVLILMQCNRETALLNPLLLAPVLWYLLARDRAGQLWVGASWLACVLVWWMTRQHFAHLPGQGGEFNLALNLQYWSRPSHWLQTTDLYTIGLPLPRASFALAVAALLACAARKPWTPWLGAATACTAAMLGLLIMLGYKDEFRAVALCLPMVLAAVAARWGQKRGIGTMFFVAAGQPSRYSSA